MVDAFGMSRTFSSRGQNEFTLEGRFKNFFYLINTTNGTKRKFQIMVPGSCQCYGQSSHCNLL